MPFPLRLILLLNAVGTFAAAIALALAPGLIPGTVGIALPENALFVTDLLAASEFALAVLATLALRARSNEAIRAAVWTLMAFHAASAMFGLLALGQGLGGVVGANVVVRVMMVALLWWFGLRGSLTTGVPRGQ
jgi:hypothetical protein